MRTRTPWIRLAQTSAAELRQIQDRAVARAVREEFYPFSAFYKNRLDEAGVDPRRVRGIADLARLPFTTKHDLLAAQSDPKRRTDFVLVPTAEKIRAHWPLSRKLPLLFGGARAREELTFDYTPNFLTFTTGRSSEPVAFAYTPHDLEVLGEAIARMFDIAEIDSNQERI